ncbi:Negative transcriptional regulator, CopY [Streptococcus pyogenes]|uniref:CopY/TcrY family copper transport repressor n=1 Tax=Streptococcus pyogenes TaxID=1314 RepID=UPI00109D719D|nr:CopY/TcrY family copper transport repressor [Streptococcus pyogenes]UEN92352.1 CopY/TcrY family copper transport repressor [Streptococcus pyogenes]VGW41790.1 Negative transcriptional regulator, CopY [Streptococcus pyogenes]VGW46352.1 Negative transcriptional regulator, CopY [Streptococcus pyogenes]VGW94322.1 Negative transcriptional regulator, CopY [Streptococcus pyogenes]VGX26428.1 Negative transcriptional regulator, CopY [Streptococcus pyogenes]
MNQNISDAEWEVMRVVWASGAIKSHDIISILTEKFAWSASTIKTLISRLVEKKALGTSRQGRAYIYEALIDQDRMQELALSTVLDKMCQRKHSKLLMGLLEDVPMTLEDIDVYCQLLERKKQTAVDQVACNCLPGQCHCQRKETY